MQAVLRVSLKPHWDSKCATNMFLDVGSYDEVVGMLREFLVPFFKELHVFAGMGHFGNKCLVEVAVADYVNPLVRLTGEHSFHSGSDTWRAEAAAIGARLASEWRSHNAKCRADLKKRLEELDSESSLSLRSRE